MENKEVTERFKVYKAGDMEVTNETGQLENKPSQSAQVVSQIDDSIGLSQHKLRDSEEEELTPS
ncbi:hypothetical protein [Desulfosporosinus sp. Sb-LF]|uniref:hypothetical protein n=1 Tax=Desulfosporosinus sp. Sb-LF TaxID=2560027 RepID=UPI00107F94A5|nr:hypothetical protein [Desulfosporosinus sp. Sb-LF]TGE33982.1 hypothetical protein E4K68_04030 [Desulfosporosinus sp. Sb-LF]